MAGHIDNVKKQEVLGQDLKIHAVRVRSGPLS
jgi:hypothetical protein